MFDVEELHFRCLGGRVAFTHLGGLLRDVRGHAEARLSDLSARSQEISGSIPMLLVREGKRGEELLKLLDEDPSISIVVLAASTDSEGPGPVISYMMKQGGSRMRVPLTIVPGSLSVEQVEQLT